MKKVLFYSVLALLLLIFITFELTVLLIGADSYKEVLPDSISI